MSIRFSLFIFLCFVFACKNETPAKETPTPSEPVAETQEPPAAAESPTEQSAESKTKTEKVEEKKPAKPAGKLTFEEKTFDFGFVDEGKIIKHEFKFTNTGNAPLVITLAKSTCGCTVPEWPMEPIEVGKSAVLKATFDTKGKLGSQNKVITVYSNGNPSKATVAIKGFVGTVAKKEAEEEPEMEEKIDSVGSNL